MLLPKTHAAAVLAALTLSLLATAPASAEPIDPNTREYGECLAEEIEGGADAGCEGLLCWCCYSNGCWICNNKPASADRECSWDPSHSAQNGPPSQANQQLLQNLLNQTLTTQPSGPGQVAPTAPQQR